VVHNNPSDNQLTSLGVFSWPIWEKEVSQFSWTYDSEETCFLLEGEVTVTPDSGESVTFGVGDMVVFPAGLSCIWNVKKAVKKHYNFA